LIAQGPVAEEFVGDPFDIGSVPRVVSRGIFRFCRPWRRVTDFRSKLLDLFLPRLVFCGDQRVTI